MPEITRRGFLTAATLALASASGTAAVAAAAPKPRAASPGPRDTHAQQGNASITVDVSSGRDVTLIRYSLTNVGTGPDPFTVWHTDQNNGRASRKLLYSLGPYASASAEVYGRINHSFVVNVCQSDGACFTVGPVGPVPSAGIGPARGMSARAVR